MSTNVYHWEPSAATDDRAFIIAAHGARVAAVAEKARGKIAAAGRTYELHKARAMEEHALVGYASDGSASGERAPTGHVVTETAARRSLANPDHAGHHLLGELARHGVPGKVLVVLEGRFYLVFLRVTLAEWLYGDERANPLAPPAPEAA